MKQTTGSVFWSIFRGAVLLFGAYAFLGHKSTHHLLGKAKCDGKQSLHTGNKDIDLKKNKHLSVSPHTHHTQRDSKAAQRGLYSNTNALPSWLDFMKEQRYMDVCMPKGTRRDAIVTRENAVPCLTHFALTNNLPKDQTADCRFSDIDHLDTHLQSKIIGLCESGLLRGQNGTFKPDQELNQAIMLSILSRSGAGYLNENTTPWFKNYYDYAVGQGWVKSGLNPQVFEQPLTRQDLGLWLYQIHKTTGASSIINN